MRKSPVFLAAFALVLFLFFPVAYGWDSAGHEWLASKVCQDFNCGCPTDEGAVAPDREFRDTINHHCYDPQAPCPAGNWTCPLKYDCPALQKAEEWIARGANQTGGCDRWRSLAIASHYFFDSKVFFHQVQKEESRCHSGFESAVGRTIGSQDWQVSKCGVAVSSSEVAGWILEFEEKLKSAGIRPEPIGSHTPTILMAAVAAIFASAMLVLFGKLKK